MFDLLTGCIVTHVPRSNESASRKLSTRCQHPHRATPASDLTAETTQPSLFEVFTQPAKTYDSEVWIVEVSINMILLTMIARVADGLPLAASMQEDEQSGRDLQHYQSQAKQLCRKLNAQSPNRCTLEAGVMSFHYVIEHGVCYLALCEAVFPKKLVFGYLEDLQTEFNEQHGKKVPTVSRPYSFIEFDVYIQKTKKNYIDSRARRNLGSINTELQDVQRIMVANIEEVLQRGEALSALDTKASDLSSLSKKYRSDAKYLNTRSIYAKIAAGAVFFITLIVYMRFWWI